MWGNPGLALMSGPSNSSSNFLLMGGAEFPLCSLTWSQRKVSSDATTNHHIGLWSVASGNKYSVYPLNVLSNTPDLWRRPWWRSGQFSALVMFPFWWGTKQTNKPLSTTLGSLCAMEKTTTTTKKRVREGIKSERDSFWYLAKLIQLCKV